MSFITVLAWASQACAPHQKPEAVDPASRATPPLGASTAAAQAIAETSELVDAGRGRISRFCTDGWKIRLGSYEYMNNMYAKAKAKGSYEQCLVSRDVDGKTELGWSWDWPGFDPLGFGYPEIIFGWKPWFSQSTDSRLPIRVGDVNALAVRYKVETQARGRWSLTPGLWLTRGVEPGHMSAMAITSEVVVWADYGKEAHPIGKSLGEVLVDGVAYEFFHQPNEGDRGDGSGWDLYYFKSPSPRDEANIDFHAILAHLLKAGRIEPDQLVASVEFGSELQSGRGTTWIKDFDVRVERRF
jgi:hypothetical protein